MSKIIINDLRPAGTDLFMDSESYLQELSEVETNVIGGATPTIVTTSSVWCVRTIIIVVTVTIPNKAS